MTGETADTRTSVAELFTEIAGILRAVTGESAEWAARITPDSAIEGDLGMSSMEVAELAERLGAVFGDRVDLTSYVAELDIDQLIGLTVADLVDYVEGVR